MCNQTWISHKLNVDGRNRWYRWTVWNFKRHRYLIYSSSWYDLNLHKPKSWRNQHFMFHFIGQPTVKFHATDQITWRLLIYSRSDKNHCNIHKPHTHSLSLSSFTNFVSNGVLSSVHSHNGGPLCTLEEYLFTLSLIGFQSWFFIQVRFFPSFGIDEAFKDFSMSKVVSHLTSEVWAALLHGKFVFA